MKITIYTTTSCQFSKQEKEYLASHGMAFEEKNLDTNKAFLTEMMTVGNNFAGTPVTKIEKDDGTVAVLKGFSAGEFNEALGIAEPPKTEEAKPAETMPAVPPAVEEPVKTEVSAPAVPPVPAESAPAADTSAPPVQTPPVEPPLNDVLNKLESTMNPAPTAAPAVPTPPTETPAIPTVESPAPAPGDAPAIPDFPADAAPSPSK